MRTMLYILDSTSPETRLSKPRCGQAPPDKKSQMVSYEGTPPPKTKYTLVASTNIGEFPGASVRDMWAQTVMREPFLTAG